MSQPVLTEGDVSTLMQALADKGHSAANSGEAARYDYFDGLLHAQAIVATTWRAAVQNHEGKDGAD